MIRKTVIKYEKRIELLSNDIRASMICEDDNDDDGNDMMIISEDITMLIAQFTTGCACDMIVCTSRTMQCQIFT